MLEIILIEYIFIVIILSLNKSTIYTIFKIIPPSISYVSLLSKVESTKFNDSKPVFLTLAILSYWAFIDS